MKNAALLILASVVLAACSIPWNIGREERELNVGFAWKENQISLPTVTVGGREGAFLLASAHPRTAVDPRFADREGIASRNVTLTFGDRRRIRVQPTTVSLHGLADATVGADAFKRASITIDYAKQLLVIREMPDVSAMPVYSYAGAPNVPVILNGKPGRAVIDTLLPDTMIVPARLAGRERGRVNVALSIGGVVFPSVNAGVADVEEIRVGNRILSNFLVTIDYSRNLVALWRDPRAGAAGPDGPAR